MAEMAEMGIGNKPCLDIRPSQDQISDRSISYAQLSKGKKKKIENKTVISVNKKRIIIYKNRPYETYIYR